MNTEQIAKIIREKTKFDGGFIEPDNTDELADQILQSLASSDEELKKWLREFFSTACDGNRCGLDMGCSDCMADEVSRKVSAHYAAKLELAKQEAKETELRKWLIALTHATQLPNVYTEGDRVKCVKGLFELVESEAKQAGRQEVVEKLLANNSFDQIDIPDEVFMSAEAKACGFTKRSFLEAGWRKVSGKQLLEG